MTGSSPRVVIGLPLYNHADCLPEALDTLLAQDFPSLALLLCDDRSTDGTDDVATRYAALDPRIVYERNAERLGYLGNANHCFRRARELFPDAEFFAWGSDHDVWHPRWLGVLVRQLEGDPAAVMAYPAAFIIDEQGLPLDRKGRRGRPAKSGAPRDRLRDAMFTLPVGTAVYGLYRVSALAKLPPFRRQLLADRLLLAELSLLGPILHTPQILFYRRYRRLYSKARQIRASFAGGRPWYTRLPWWLSHAVELARSPLQVAGKDGEASWSSPASLALAYAGLGVKFEARRLYRSLAGSLREGASAIASRRWLARGRSAARMALRRR